MASRPQYRPLAPWPALDSSGNRRLSQRYPPTCVSLCVMAQPARPFPSRRSRPHRPARGRSILPAIALLALMTAGGVTLVTLLPGVDLSGRRIPQVALAAYRRAASEAGSVAKGCSVDWTILAGL